MRHRVPNYTINGQYIILDTDITIEDVRLIINETQKTVICSSMNKENISIDKNVIKVDESVCTLAEGDYLTIEIDKGDSGEELAKQGDNPEATNSKILEEVQKKLTPLEAVLTELNNGKQELVDALAMKNVQSSADKTLSAIADDVRNIAQNKTEFTGEDYSKVITRNGLTWDVVQVALTDQRGQYVAKVVVEYAKDSDTISLSGADAYATSDGAYYEESIVHTWTEDGKVNRYVIYYFNNENVTFNIVDVGQELLSVFVVGGVIVASALTLNNINIRSNETIKDLQFVKNSIQNTDNVFLHIKDHTKDYVLANNSTARIIYIKVDNMSAPLIDSNGSFNNVKYLELDLCETLNNVNVIGYRGRSISNFNTVKKVVIRGVKYMNNSNLLNLNGTSAENYISTIFSNTELIEIPDLIKVISGSIFYQPEVISTSYFLHGVKTISIPSLEYTSVPIWGLRNTNNRDENTMSLERLYAPNLKYCTKLFTPMNKYRAFYNLIDVHVGEIMCDFDLSVWHPAYAIQDDNKKATLLDNIHNHIAARVKDVSQEEPLTITFSQEVRDILLPETEVLFASKNWNIAPTKSV